MRKKLHLGTKHDMLPTLQNTVENSACQNSLREKNIPKELEGWKTLQWQLWGVCREDPLARLSNPAQLPSPLGRVSTSGLNKRPCLGLPTDSPHPFRQSHGPGWDGGGGGGGGPLQSREPSGDSSVLPQQVPADSVIRQA